MQRGIFMSVFTQENASFILNNLKLETFDLKTCV